MNVSTCKRYEFEITLPVRSPVISAGLSQAGFGFDISHARDEMGHPILPMDHIRGHLFHAFRKLASRNGSNMDECRLKDWFGVKAGSDLEPNRGRITPSDFIATCWHVEGCAKSNSLLRTKSKSETSVRIEIDDDKGSVKTGALVFVELIAPFDAHIEFKGTLTAYLNDTEVKDFRNVLKKALDIIPAVGGMKSAGFGEVERDLICLSEPRITSLLPEKIDTDTSDRIMFDVEFDRPILVDADQVSNNVFIGRPIIPGATIKGALACRLELAGECPQKNAALSKLLVSHAFPLDKTCRRELKTPLPMSLCAKGDVVKDALLATEGILVDGQAAAFQGDWKGREWQAASRIADLPTDETIPHLQRMRVKIVQDGRNVAKDEDLHIIAPISERLGGKEKRRWRFSVDRNGADGEEFEKYIAILNGGLDGVGRTDARMIIASHKPVEDYAVAQPYDRDQNLWVVMLKTPAQMLDPDGKWDAQKQYAVYWQWVFDDLSVTLQDHFAAERWTGGYIAERFRMFNHNRYCPFILTEPGSVFLLKGDLQEKLDGLLRSGLPARKYENSPHHELTWRHTPYLPENGYGQIIINPDLHRKMRGENEKCLTNA